MASQLDLWLRSLSKGALASVVIAAGILFIILSDPPRTVCDAQIEMFRAQQASFLFPDEAKKGSAKGGDIKSLFKYCEADPGPGACYELFAKIRTMLQDMRSVPNECAGKLGGEKVVDAALWKTIKLMVNSAWGKTAPASPVDRAGWLSSADIALFCDLSAQIIRLYGKEPWDDYRNSLFTELPGASTLPRNEAWGRMLVTEDCSRYLKPGG